MKTTGGNGYPLPDDAELEDVVQSEAEAIRLAEAWIADFKIRKLKHLEEYSKRPGFAYVLEEYLESPLIYTIRRTYVHPKGWVVGYEVSDESGSTFDPSFFDVCVNKKTGEATFRWFRDD